VQAEEKKINPRLQCLSLDVVRKSNASGGRLVRQEGKLLVVVCCGLGGFEAVYEVRHWSEAPTSPAKLSSTWVIVVKVEQKKVR
jgi:hypothetical protein